MKKLSILFVLLALLAVSSNHFEEMNQNPDKTNKAPSSWIATSVLRGAFRFHNPVPKEFYQGSNQTNKLVCRLATTENIVQYYYSYSP